MFWVWLARLQGGLGSHGGLTVEVLAYCGGLHWRGLAAGISQPPGEPPAALWSDQGKELNKKQREKAEREWRCAASRPQCDTLVRDQCSSCGQVRTIAKGGRSMEGSGGEAEQFVDVVLEYKTGLKQSPHWRHS